MAKFKLSEALRVGKEFQDVPQAFTDPERTQGKLTELREAIGAGAGLSDDIEAIRENPLAFGVATGAGAALESLREYAGDTIEFDIYDAEGNAIFPPTAPSSPA